MTTLKERFDSKWTPEPFSGCWLWTAHCDRFGYGTIHHSGHKMKRAHRVSWELSNGDIPEHMDVLHKCDVPSCVNPEHLFLGNDYDNMRDALAKGRLAIAGGEKNGRAILKKIDILRIRNSDVPTSELAREYGVSFQAIWRARKRISWAMIPEEIRARN